MKKNLFILLIIASIILAVFYWANPQGAESKTTNQTTPTPEGETIKIIYSDWPPDLIFYLAQEKGFFKENNVSVELVKIADYDELNFQKDTIKTPKIWAYTILDFMKDFGEDNSAQVFFIQDYSTGADAILVPKNSTISSITDLKGKTIGVETDTTGEFYLHFMLNREEMSFSDVTLKHLGSSEIPKALLNNEIDAGVTYEPDTTKSINYGATPIADSTNEKNAIVDVLVATKNDLDTYPTEYQNLVNAILQATTYFEENPEESVKIMSEPFDLTQSEINDAFKGITISNTKTNKAAFQRGSGPESIYILMKQAEVYLEEQGFTIDDSLLSELVNTDFVLAN